MTAVRAILSTISGLAQGRPGFAAMGGLAAEQLPDPWAGEYAHAGPEPLLDDLLDDPLILSVMRADHVEAAELRRQLGRAPLPA